MRIPVALKAVSDGAGVDEELDDTGKLLTVK